MNSHSDSSANPLFWRVDHLVSNKQQLAQADSPLQPAYQKLIRDADKALAGGPYSVLDKPMVAPSGDKQDYYSVGPYWWPNPATADGLPYVRRDGEVNPERDRYDAAARSHMENSVITLALAYFFSDQEAYAAHAATLLRTWFLDSATRMKPHLDYGQGIPGICDGRGIGIIETHVFPSVLDAMALLRTADHWSATDHAALQAWFRTYLDWLLTSKHGRDEAVEHNNHGTWYDVQVAAFALFVGEREIARRALAENTSERIVTQIAPDGSQPHELARTRSLSYSAMNLQAFMDAADMGSRVGVDLWHFTTGDARGVHSAVNYLVAHAVEQPWTRQQITPVKPSLLLPMLYRAATAYHDHSYLEKMDHLPAEHTREQAHLLYSQTVN